MLMGAYVYQEGSNRDVGKEEILQLIDLAERNISGLDTQENMWNVIKLKNMRNQICSHTWKLAVIGNYKSGKSTFINALLGCEILPAYAIPTTAVTSIVRYGESPKAVIHFLQPLPKKIYQQCMIPDRALKHMWNYQMRDIPPLTVSLQELEKYLVIPMGMEHEEASCQCPYQKIEIFSPLQILKDGIEIIDCTGLYEIPPRQQTNVEFLKKADAVVLFFNALARGFTGEISFIKNTLQENRIAGNNLFCVVNRFDQLDWEWERQQIRDSFNCLLAPYTSHMIYCLSALQGLQAKKFSNMQTWEKSGMLAIDSDLKNNMQQKKQVMIEGIQKELKECVPKVNQYSGSGGDTREYFSPELPSVENEQLIKPVQEKELIFHLTEIWKNRIYMNASKEASDYLASLPAQIEAWYADFKPKRQISLLHLKITTESMIDESCSFLQNKIISEMHQWYLNQYMPMLVRKSEEFQESLKAAISDFGDCDIEQEFLEDISYNWEKSSLSSFTHLSDIFTSLFCEEKKRILYTVTVELFGRIQNRKLIVEETCNCIQKTVLQFITNRILEDYDKLLTAITQYVNTDFTSIHTKVLTFLENNNSEICESQSSNFKIEKENSETIIETALEEKALEEEALEEEALEEEALEEKALEEEALEEETLEEKALEEETLEEKALEEKALEEKALEEESSEEESSEESSMGLWEGESLDFKTRQMYEVSDIERHIRFIKTLTEKYDFPVAQKKQIADELKKITQKLSQKSLKMAVVGEFSSGKSSFINALLRENLLETDAVQGTTVTSTLIEFQTHKSLTIHKKSGDLLEVAKLEQNGGLGALLQAYTSGKYKDEDIEYLEVGHPSDFLEKGICIIDTPGTNSLEKWHEEITKQTVSEQADACIILTSAEKPFPETFCRFLEDNLSDVLQNCIYVVTKIDLILPKQQERQMRYIQKILHDKLEIHKPVVFSYSALPILNGTCPEYNAINLETENKIIRFLQDQRTKILLQRCMSLLEQTVEHLQENMRRISMQRQKEHDQLMQALTKDLEDFVHEQKKEIEKSFLEDYDIRVKEFTDSIAQNIRSKSYEVYQAFREPKTESDIRSFLQSKLVPLLEEKKNEILENAGMQEGDSQFQNTLETIVTIYSSQFEENFMKQYEQLTLLAYDLIEKVDVSAGINEFMVTNIQIDSSLKQKIQSSIKDENRSFLGKAGTGVAAGAAIGSVVPVIGTAAGAIIGGIVGTIHFGKKANAASKAEEFRKEVSKNMSTMVESYFKSLKDSMIQVFIQGLKKSWNDIEHIMELYLAQYSEIVKEMRSRDQKAQKMVEQEINAIQNDMLIIQQRIDQIQSIKSKINEL